MGDKEVDVRFREVLKKFYWVVEEFSRIGEGKLEGYGG